MDSFYSDLAVQIMDPPASISPEQLREAIYEAQRLTLAGENCDSCGGLGRRAYGSTSTWSGGAGGQMMTADVCDRCWGSGDVDLPGEDLRVVLRERRECKRMLDLLERAARMLRNNYQALDSAERDAVADIEQLLKKIGE
jgi:hypothetical protein